MRGLVGLGKRMMGWRGLGAPRGLVLAQPVGLAREITPRAARVPTRPASTPVAGRVTTTNSIAIVGIVIKVRRVPRAQTPIPPVRTGAPAVARVRVRAAAPVAATARDAVLAVLTA